MLEMNRDFLGSCKVNSQCALCGNVIAEEKENHARYRNTLVSIKINRDTIKSKHTSEVNYVYIYLIVNTTFGNYKGGLKSS